ncbi:ComF family protein [Holzapfeliella sp. JNUCC 80]
MGVMCLICKKPIMEINLYQLVIQRNQAQICEGCLVHFEAICDFEITCKMCQKPLEQKKNQCGDCQKWQKLYPNDSLKNVACYRYNQAFKTVIKRYKRSYDASISEVFVALIKRIAIPKSYDYYVSLPTSSQHFKERQFDHIALIFSKIYSLTPLLKYINDSNYQAQGEKNRRARLKTQQMFVCDNFDFDETTKILLLDDIYTTGRTLYHARDAIRKTGFKGQIDSLSIAR